jgi:hypothetical protein
MQHNSTNLREKGKMDKRSKRARQRAWVAAYKSNLFNVTEACKKIEIDRSTYYRWLESDPDFAQRVQDAREEKIDFIEDQLLERISSGDTTAIIFALKTLAKHRGYVERQEIVGPVTPVLPLIDIKILLQNPQIRLALENISNELSDGSTDIKHLT